MEWLVAVRRVAAIAMLAFMITPTWVSAMAPCRSKAPELKDYSKSPEWNAAWNAWFTADLACNKAALARREAALRAAEKAEAEKAERKRVAGQIEKESLNAAKTFAKDFVAGSTASAVKNAARDAMNRQSGIHVFEREEANSVITSAAAKSQRSITADSVAASINETAARTRTDEALGQVVDRAYSVRRGDPISRQAGQTSTEASARVMSGAIDKLDGSFASSMPSWAQTPSAPAWANRQGSSFAHIDSPLDRGAETFDDRVHDIAQHAEIQRVAEARQAEATRRVEEQAAVQRAQIQRLVLAAALARQSAATSAAVAPQQTFTPSYHPPTPTPLPPPATFNIPSQEKCGPGTGRVCELGASPG